MSRHKISRLFLILVLLFVPLSAYSDSMQINGLSAPVSGVSVGGFAALYGPSGIFAAGTNPKLFVAQVTSTTSGTWSVSFTGSGVNFTAAPYIFLQPVSSGIGTNTMFNATVTSSSTSGASGSITTPTVAVIGNQTIIAASTATTLNVLAVGW